mmetsp:Transcript_34561/g.81618  ORF Transcript_34561/g.81618 Transcript_34561/m.81618 type:complete len:228 (+) Transcript_34561:129-812(+)
MAAPRRPPPRAGDQAHVRLQGAALPLHGAQRAARRGVRQVLVGDLCQEDHGAPRQRYDRGHLEVVATRHLCPRVRHGRHAVLAAAVRGARASLLPARRLGSLPRYVDALPFVRGGHRWADHQGAAASAGGRAAPQANLRERDARTSEQLGGNAAADAACLCTEAKQRPEPRRPRLRERGAARPRIGVGRPARGFRPEYRGIQGAGLQRHAGGPGRGGQAVREGGQIR